MAGPPFDVATAAAAAAALPSHNSSPSFVFDVYDDAHGAAAARSGDMQPPAPSLPTGRCNFVDLTHGSSGPQCGCRRFWSRTNLVAATPVAASFGASHGSAGSDLSQAGWCMCSHHACFHDQGASTQPGAAPSLNTSSLFGLPPPPPPQPPPPLSTPLGQENERPRTHRAPLSPVQDPMAFQVFADADGTQDKGNGHSFGGGSNTGDMLSLGLLPFSSSMRIGSSFGNLLSDPPAFGQVDGPAALAVDHATSTPTPTATSVAPSVVGHANYDGSIPDTLSCGGACLPSQMPLARPSSITSSVSQTRYLRPFAGKGLQTLTHTSAPSPLQRKTLASTLPADVHETVETGGGEATQPATQQQQPPPPAGLSSIASAVQAHEQRLDKLENASFSVVPGQEEWSERHDHMDLRVTELESRVDEVEKRLNTDDTASGSMVLSRRRLLGHDDDATTVSMDTSMAGIPVPASSSGSSELRSQIQALQAQIELLQAAAPPTYNKPWELEVVFLPFPLKGVWVEASQFPTAAAVAAAAAAQRRQSGSHRRYSMLSHHGGAGGAGGAGKEDDEWTQMPNTLSRQTPDPQSPCVGGTADWSGDWAEGEGSLGAAPRLLPRACAPGRVMDNRLRSCGLVQTLAVRGSDARSLQLAMAAAFGPVWEAMAGMSPGRASASASAKHGSSSLAEADLATQFLGLQHAWVPLRKIHKDSRLRFLTRAEMVTPNLWDAAFLMSSVVMKATGRQRLYVTHPDAYLQGRQAYHAGWSWQRLRDLSRVVSATATATADSLSSSLSSAEACWAWDSRLDEFPSASLTSSMRHRPSPSPFSRETTPVAVAPAPAVAPTAPTGPTAVPPPASHLSTRSHRSSGSAQPFYTAAQSPLMAPWTHVAGTIARRSPSPFLSASLGPRSAPPQPSLPAPSSAPPTATTRRSRRPTPIRTTSMPAPPSQTASAAARPASLLATQSSPSPGAKRRMLSARGHHVATSSTSSAPLYQYQHQRPGQPTPTFVATPALTYERRPSPLVSSVSRASPRGRLPSPVPATNGPSTTALGKRRRSTRSPSGFWPRYTPRRSMSRSPSVPPAVPVWAQAQGQAQGQVQAQGQAQAQPPAQPTARQTGPPAAGPNRGATPFCYATPHSNAPTLEPASARRRSSRRSSRAGSARPTDYDLDMLGEGMDGYDDDFPMTQDVDSASEDRDAERYDVDVYEDEDVLDQTDRGVPAESARTGYGQPSSAAPLLPEDEPWPGIEDDNEIDNDAHMSDSENMEPSGESGRTGESGYSMPPTQGSPASVRSAHRAHSLPASDPSSSQPSEYPSTHPAWPVGAAALAAMAQEGSLGRMNRDRNMDMQAFGQGREREVAAVAAAALRRQQLQQQQQQLQQQQLQLQQQQLQLAQPPRDAGMGFIIHEDMDDGRMGVDG